MPDDLRQVAEEDGVNEAVKDYIAGMTDRFALNIYTELFVPKKLEMKIFKIKKGNGSFLRIKTYNDVFGAEDEFFF